MPGTRWVGRYTARLNAARQTDADAERCTTSAKLVAEDDPRGRRPTNRYRPGPVSIPSLALAP